MQKSSFFSLMECSQEISEKFSLPKLKILILLFLIIKVTYVPKTENIIATFSDYNYFMLIEKRQKIF